MFVLKNIKNILKLLTSSAIVLVLVSWLVAQAHAANGINKIINFQGKVTNSNGTNVNDGTYDFVVKFYDGASSGATNSYTETWSSAALWSSTMSSAPSSGGESLTYSTNTNESTIKVGQILWNTTKEESVVVTSVNTTSNVIGISPTRQAWAGSDTVTNKIYVKDGTFKVAINSLNQDLSGVNFGTDSIFLGINFNGDGEMKPRIQYTAAPYAFNAEKVNGLTVTNTSDNPFSSTTILKIGDGKTVVFSNSITFSGTDSTTFTLPTGSGTVATLDSTGTFTNKTIGSTGLTFSGATTDVTTASNEDFVVTPNGTGKIGFGTFASGPLAFLDVRNPLGTTAAASISAQSAFASLVVDNRGLGDLFTASSSGMSRFVITQAGNVGIGTILPSQKLEVNGSASILGNLTGLTGLTLSSGGINLGGTVGNSSQCLLGGASAGWGTCPGGGSGVSYWQTVTSGVISPYIDSVDLLIGGVSTASAKFAFINNSSGTPTATFSGNFSIQSPTGVSPAIKINALNNGTLGFRTSPGGDAGATERLTILNNGNVGIGTTTPKATFEVVGTASVAGSAIFKGPDPWTDVKAYGARGDSTTDDTQAIQAAINAAASTTNRTIYFPAGRYKVTSTLQVNTRGLRFIGPYGDYTAASAGTRIEYTGTGALFQIGTDNGHVYDAGDYDGVQGAVFSDLTIRYTGVSTTALNNGQGNYGTGTYGIRDWRGGEIFMYRVRIDSFEYGFWGIQSDIDHFEDVKVYNNKVGIYLGPRSDQATIEHLYSLYNDTALWLDRSKNSRVIASQFVGDGSATEFPIKIGSAWTVGNDGNEFIGNWFEHVQGYDEIEAFVSIGVSDSVQTTNVTFRDNFMISNNQVTTMHSKYFLKIDNATNIVIDGLSGAPEALSKLLEFTGSTSPDVHITAQSAQKTSYDNLGTGNPQVNKLLWGSGNTLIPTGNVGIGTTSPVGVLHIAGGTTGGNAALVIDQTGATGALLAASVSGTTKFMIDRAGNVGIGTTAPSYYLDVQGSVTPMGIGTTSNAGRIFFRRGTDGSTTGFLGYATAGEGSEFKFSESGGGGFFSFYTNVNTVVAERIRFANSGNIGVGTTTPKGLIHIVGGTAGGNAALIVDQTGSSGNNIFSASASGVTKFNITNSGAASMSGALTVGDGTATNNVVKTPYGPLVLQYKSGTNTWSNGLYLQDVSGNVGIGTVTPLNKLFISGTGTTNGLGFEGGTTKIYTDGSNGSIRIVPGNGFVGIRDAADGNDNLLISDTYTRTRQALCLGAQTTNCINGSATANWFSTGNVGIGSTAPIGLLNIDGKATGKALAIFNQLTGGDQDLFTASQAGITKFTIGNTGNITATGTLTGLTGLTLASGAINVSGSDGTGSQCLKGGSTAAWGSCGAGSSQWTDAGTDIYFNTGNVGIGTTVPVGMLSVSGSTTLAQGAALAMFNQTGTADVFTASLSGTTKFVIKNSGNVGIGTANPLATLDVRGLSGTAPIASVSGNTTFAGLVIDNAGSGDLLAASVSGVSRFTIGNQGGITVNSGSSDIHKTTSGSNSKDTDFTRTANSTSSTLTNLTASNNAMSLDSGTVPNSGTGTITTSSQPTFPAAPGDGSQTIMRADGKYLVIRGAASTTMYIYDSLAGTITASSQVTNAAVGAGAIALPRSDGRYRVVHGGSVTTSSLVDPMGAAAVGASAAIGTAPSANGTVAYRRQNGRYFIAIGGTTATSVWDPSPATDTFTAGPTANTTGVGALLLPRPDGSALLVNGGATATTQLYDPLNGTSAIGSLTSGPALPTNCEINGSGSVAIQLPNWRYIILSKANVSVEYDAVTNTMGTCQAIGPGTAMGNGGHAFRLQNRKIMIIPGGTATAVYLYNPDTNTYTTHGSTTTAVGAGGQTIQRHDGTFQLVAGNSTTTTNNIDTGLVMGGSYVSEDFNSTDLNINSTILWSQGAENIFIGTSSATTNTPQSNVEVFVRTASTQGGLSSAADKPIQRSGDLISAAGTDQWARVTINFRRPIPQNIVDERFTFFGNGSTVYMKDYAGPTVYDYTIDNSTVLRRTAFNFANSQLDTASHEASNSSLLRVQAQLDRLTLPAGAVPGPTMVAGHYTGQVGPHPTTLASTGEGTIVMALPDGQFGVIATASAAVSYSIYDPASNVFIPQSGAGDVPTTYPGAGAFALKLPNGEFLIVFGADIGGTTRTTTNIYNPRAASGSRFRAGPALSAAAGIGALPIRNSDGTYTITHGAATTTSSLFNPFTDLKGLATLPAGPTLTTAMNCGSWAIPLQGQLTGQYRVFTGVAQFTTGITTSMVYDGNRKVFIAGPALTGNHGCGSYAFQKPDGYWVSVAAGGGTTGAQSAVTQVINPFTNTNGAGTSLTAAVGRGSVVIPRADGTYLITRGQGATNGADGNASNIWSPYGGAMVAGTQVGTAIGAGPTLVSNSGAGAIAFQRADGKFVLINGGHTGSNNVNTIDVGWYPDGQYLSGQMYVPQLSQNSVLSYKALSDQYLNFEIRTASSRQALMTADYRSVYPADANLNAASTDKWMQVQINFSRTFPSYSDTMQDVWPGRGAFNWRTISQPTLFEYKVTNDPNLLTLQSNGQNIFRVSGSGNIYAGQQGAFFSAGADLAERYTSTQSLDAGDVVVADGTNPHGVVRSGSSYQRSLLGVVSTEPGFVAGAYTPDSYPIALVGRVPVKVSTENGSIKSGDYVTSASIPGYAMRATQAGRVIGKALEDLDESKLSTCALPGADPSAKCGTIMMFVNLTDYAGDPVEVAMGERKTQTVLGLEENIKNTGISSVGWMRIGENKPTDDQAGVLSFLKDLKETKAQPTSQIFTDRISAAFDIISPTIITDTLFAHTIKADRIEGLEIYTDKLGALSSEVRAFLASHHESTGSAVLSATTSATVSLEDSINASYTAMFAHAELTSMTGLNVVSATVSSDFRVKGSSLIEGVLSVIDTIVTKNIIVSGTMNVIGETFFKGKTTFEDHAVFSKDSGGFAIIKKGEKQVTISFSKDYDETPVVSANPVVADVILPDGKKEDKEVTQKRLFDMDIRYLVTNRSEKGFTIVLNKEASEDLTFSWLVLSVKQATTTTSSGTLPMITQAISAPSDRVVEKFLEQLLQKKN